MSLYEFLKTIHVLAAVAWGGAAAVSHFLGFLAERSGDPQRMATYVEDQAWLGKHYYAPASITVLIAGIAMVVVSGWQFTDAWIVIGLVLFLMIVPLGMFVLSPKSEQLAAAIRERGLEDPGVQAQAEQLKRFALIDLLLLVLVIADMVIKPGA